MQLPDAQVFTCLTGIESDLISCVQEERLYCPLLWDSDSQAWRWVQDMIQRYLHKLKEWAHVDLMRFTKARVTSCIWVRAILCYLYRLGYERIESRGEGPVGTCGWNTGYEPASWPHSPESQLYPRLPQKKQGKQVKGPDSALCSGSSPPLKSLAQEIHGPVRAAWEEGYEIDQRDKTPLLWGQAERAEIVQPGKVKGLDRLYCSLSTPTEGCLRKMVTDV